MRPPASGSGKRILPVAQAKNLEFIFFFPPTSNLSRSFLLQDLCTCNSLCLKCFSSDYLQGSRLHFESVLKFRPIREAFP